MIKRVLGEDYEGVMMKNYSCGKWEKGANEPSMFGAEVPRNSR